MGARFERYKIRHDMEQEQDLPNAIEIQSIIGKIIHAKYKEIGNTRSEMMDLADSIYKELFNQKRTVEDLGEFIGHLTIIFSILVAKCLANQKSS